jgi:hypothetical protein
VWDLLHLQGIENFNVKNTLHMQDNANWNYTYLQLTNPNKERQPFQPHLTEFCGDFCEENVNDGMCSQQADGIICNKARKVSVPSRAKSAFRFEWLTFNMVASNNTMAAPAASSEKVFFDGKSDLYEGHKVVAMPNSAFGGKTVRDVVSSVNIDYTNSSPTRRRSRSIGRSPASRSRDIVQDVYNRIGVNYIRGRPSIESLLDDSNIVVLPPSGNKERARHTSRGRSITRGSENADSRGRSKQARSITRGSENADSRGRSEQVSDDAIRSRSMSRGRVALRWPPERSTATATNSSQPAGIAFNHSASPDRPTLGASPQMKERSNYAPQRRSTPQPLNSTFGQRSVPSDKKKRQSYPDTRDEQAEAEATNQEEKRDVVCVKGIISAYGPLSKSVPSGRSIRRSYNNQFNKRDRPPKVDIYYGNSNGSIDYQGDRDCIASIARSADASETVGQNSLVSDSRKRYSSANSASHRSVRSAVADAFLAAISPNKTPSSPAFSKNIPIVEIHSDALNAPVDTASLAASSVSGDDFNLSPRKMTSNSFGGAFKSAGYRNASGMSGEKLERYIEDRVHAQVAGMTQSIEACFERDYKTRIEELERQTIRLNTMISKLMWRANSLKDG